MRHRVSALVAVGLLLMAASSTPGQRAPTRRRSAGRLELLDDHAARAAGGVRRQGVPHRRGSGAVRGARPSQRNNRDTRGTVGRRRRRQRLQRVLVGPRRPRGARQRPDAHVAHRRSAGRPDAGADRRRPAAGGGARRGAARSIRPTAPRIDRSASGACCSTPARRCCPGRTTTTSRFCRRRDHVVILNEMIHDARVVPLDGRPHLPAAIRRLAGRLARPLGRQHAGRRDHELLGQDQREGIGRAAAPGRALHARRTRRRCSTSSPSTIRRRSSSRGPRSCR